MQQHTSRRALAAVATGAAGGVAAALEDIRAARRRDGRGLASLLPVRGIRSSISGERFRYELTLVDHAFHHVRSGSSRSMGAHPKGRVSFAWLSPRGHHGVFEIEGQIDASTPGMVVIEGRPRLRSMVPNPETPEGRQNPGSGAKDPDPGARAASCPPGSMCIPFDQTSDCMIISLCAPGGYRVCAVC